MASNPFPLAVGRTWLSFTLTDDRGTPVHDAGISAYAEMNAMGMLPLRGQGRERDSGVYDLELVWPMMGLWRLDVSAAVPGQEDVIREQFEVFVYPISPRVSDSQITFRSAREVNALISDPARELLIFIPLGTEAMMRTAHSDDIIPEKILLHVDGQNTLVIQNDDIADHTIGPFFVRSGEMIRQTFRQPAVFQGACSINESTVVSIVVEG